MQDSDKNQRAAENYETAAAELDWIVAHGYSDVNTEPEGIKSRTLKKFKENPFIPIGCLATAGVLTMGLVSMAQGKTNRSQLFMRLRVLSQGLTVAALIGGVLVGATKK